MATLKKDPESQADSRSKLTAEILAEVKFPLVFFGLALLVNEGAFSTVFFRNSTQTVQMAVIVSMSLLFLVSILLVGLLVWKVPTHLMMTATAVEKEADKTQTLLEHIEKVRGALVFIQQWKLNGNGDPDALLAMLVSVTNSIKGDSGTVPVRKLPLGKVIHSGKKAGE